VILLSHSRQTAVYFTLGQDQFSIHCHSVSKAKYSELLGVSINEQQIHEYRPRKSKEFRNKKNRRRASKNRAASNDPRPITVLLTSLRPFRDDDVT